MQGENKIPYKESHKPRKRSCGRFTIYCTVTALLLTLVFLVLQEVNAPTIEDSSILNIIWTFLFLAIAVLTLFVLATSAVIILISPFKKHRWEGFFTALGSIFLILLAWGFIMPTMGRVRPIAKHIVCAINLRGMGTAFIVYANEYNDELPTFENWCDLLIMKADCRPRTFVCSSSGVLEGESSYVLNENVAGMKLSEIPEDVVLLFETSIDQSETERNFSITSRKYFKDNPEWFDHYDESMKVRKSRWNQVGGPEVLTTENHQGRGCNILFADGHAEFVFVEEIPSLRWKP